MRRAGREAYLRKRAAAPHPTRDAPAVARGTPVPRGCPSGPGRSGRQRPPRIGGRAGAAGRRGRRGSTDSRSRAPVVGQPVDERQADGRSVGHGHRDAAVELDDRRRIDRREPAVERRDLRPSRSRSGVRRLVVQGRDRRLELVRPRAVRAGAPLDERTALLDPVRVPATRGPGPRAARASPVAPTRASRRASWSSISASSPAASGSSGISETRIRASRMASALSSRRTSASPDDAA